MIARIGFHPAMIVVRPLAQHLLTDLGDADDVAEEVHHQLRSRRQIAVNDNAIEAVIDEDQDLTEQLDEDVHGGSGGLPRGFFPLASAFACRAASLASCSACSRAWRSLARASIFARASASLRKRSSRRASSSGIDMPSGMSAASAASALAIRSATSAFNGSSLNGVGKAVFWVGLGRDRLGSSLL